MRCWSPRWKIAPAYKNVFVQPVAGNAGTAIGAVLEAWHGVYRRPTARRHEHAEPRAQLRRRRDQAGAGKLQAALPLPGHHRRSRRERRGAAQRQQDRRLDAGPHGVRPARAGQPQHSGIALEPVFHREPEHLHQASRAVPQVRRLGAGGTVRRVFRSRPQRALPGDRGPRQARASRDRSPPRPWPATWSASTPSIATRIRCTGSSCTPPAKPPACRCSTTRASTCSASRWSARRATPCAASTPRESTPCSSATSSCRSKTGLAAYGGACFSLPSVRSSDCSRPLCLLRPRRARSRAVRRLQILRVPSQISLHAILLITRTRNSVELPRINH